jgi:hypothetical protein
MIIKQRWNEMRKRMMKIGVAASLFFAGGANAQVINFNMDSALKKYAFIQPDSAKLHNDSVTLEPFYKKLYELQSTGQGRVNIVHIGDSHIQADFFTGVVRQLFHLDFGNAGRGTIFPYRMAKSNEPFDYRTSSPSKWLYRRNLFRDDTLPMGLAGYTIETYDTAASLTVLMKGQHGIDYGTNKVTLFHERTMKNFDISVLDSSRREIGYINMLTPSVNSFTSIVQFDKLYNRFTLKPCPKDPSQKRERIYGMMLENGKPGVLYNMIGVNGGGFRNYYESTYFMEQLAYLQADLIIISMGTNESLAGKYFSAKELYQQIDSLVTQIKRSNPNACILLTTPGDSFKKAGRKGRVKNPDIIETKNTIIQYAMDHNLAWWDWFAGCGGYGSMAKWYSNGLADRYRIHYSMKGYQMQGELFYKAIMKSYAKYAKSRMN